MRDAVRPLAESPWEAAIPVGQANRRRASESLDDAPHRPRLPSYPPAGPTDRLPDLCGSLSTLLGINMRGGVCRNGGAISLNLGVVWDMPKDIYRYRGC